MWTALALLSLLLAAIPCGLFLANLREYRPLPRSALRSRGMSLLIPARDEEANIAAALASALKSAGVELEVIVLDDHSTDATAEIVNGLAARDPRVRLIRSAKLPVGWCGKNFACQQLADAATHPVLIFMDADVRVSGIDSLARVADFLKESGVALVSGVPLQTTGTWMEILIVPLIHFVLLGFLPLRRMRATTDPAFAAACGQILAVDRDAYRSSGGHSAVRDRIHDAVALTRNFRAHGLRTDLFDATDSFACRMYSDAAQVWNGFAKNAHEGLGSRALIVPATIVLLGGQVLPFILMATAARAAHVAAVVAVICAWLPRLLAAKKFHKPMIGAALHPLAIAVLVLIQWHSLICRALGKRVMWKTRSAG